MRVCGRIQPFVTMSDSQPDMGGMVVDDASDSGAEDVQLTTTRLAHYRETLCAVKPLHSSASNTALILTRQQHIELLNVSIMIRSYRQIRIRRRGREEEEEQEQEQEEEEKEEEEEEEEEEKEK